jgi:hypothetical protein
MGFSASLMVPLNGLLLHSRQALYVCGHFEFRGKLSAAAECAAIMTSDLSELAPKFLAGPPPQVLFNHRLCGPSGLCPNHGQE